jgi:peroxiredoxin
MKRIAISITALLTVAALAVTAFGQQDNNQQAPKRERKPRPTVARPGAEQEQLAQKLQMQIEEMKAAHQDLIAQLKAIHAAAIKEKATETAGQIQKLISRQQEAFQVKLRQMEMQQQRLEKATKDRADKIKEAQRQGRQAPDFELNSFDGRNVKLADFKDNIVVLEWFNMDCPFVQYHYDKVKTMIDLAGKYKDKNVVWLAINSTSGTTVEANRDFAKKHKLPYPILDDRSGKVGRLYGAVTTPHMFVIDKGTIVYDGAIDNAPLGKPTTGGNKINYVDKVLSELTSGQPVSVSNTPSYGCSVKYPSR